MIITDTNFLSEECEKANLFEANNIIDQLVNELYNSQSGIGLAANQIGLKKKFALLEWENSLSIL